MILANTISVWQVKSTSGNYRVELPRHDATAQILAGQEVKRFGEADSRGNVLIRWDGHTYLARESDLKPAPEGVPLHCIVCGEYLKTKLVVEGSKPAWWCPRCGVDREPTFFVDEKLVPKETE